MEDSLLKSPAEIVDENIDRGKSKANLPTIKTILQGVLAGIFIGMGAQASSVAAHSVANVGLSRTIAGCVFPIGLMMIVFLGGELFTGNTMIAAAAFEKKATWYQYARNLTIIFFSNFLGAFIIVALTSLSGQWNYTEGLLGAYTIKVAYGKTGLDFVTAFSSGILCNLFVCVAVLMAVAAKDAAGKIFGVFFPIFAFVVSGFEHCVANMYYIPAGLLAKLNPKYLEKAEEAYGLTADKLESLSVAGMIKNLIPVTLGNIVGGGLFIGIFLVVINKRVKQKRLKKDI